MADPFSDIERLVQDAEAGRVPPQPPAAPPVQPQADDPFADIERLVAQAEGPPVPTPEGETFVVAGDPRIEALPSDALITREEMAQDAESRLGDTVAEMVYAQGVQKYRPEVGRIIMRAARKFPEEVGPEITAEVPVEEPGFFSTLAQVTSAGMAHRTTGRFGAPNPFLDPETLDDEGLWEAAKEKIRQEEGKPSGTKVTALDALFAFLGTTERLSAADDVAELTGESYGVAVWQALKPPQFDQSRPPRDYIWVEQERAYREFKANPGNHEDIRQKFIKQGSRGLSAEKQAGVVRKALGMSRKALVEWGATDRRSDADVFGRAIAKAIMYDPLSWVRAPATVASKARAIKDIRTMAWQFAQSKPAVGDIDGFAKMVTRAAEEALDTGNFFEGMLQVKNRLRNIDPALARVFDAQAMEIGKAGWRVSNPALDVVELALGATGGVLRGAGAALRAPAILGRAVTRRGGLPRAAVAGAAAAPEIAGEAISAAGRAVGAPGRALASARATVSDVVTDLPWLGPPVRTSKGAMLASKILDSTPWGRTQAAIREMVTTEAEDFPRGMGAAWLEGRTEFDAYASRMSFHHQRKAESDVVSHDNSRSIREISAVGSEVSTIPHAQRTGRRLRNAIVGAWGKGHRTWIDHTTGEILESVRQKRRLEDERGFVQAIFEWTHLRSKELMDLKQGGLVSAEHASELLEVIDRRTRIEARMDALDKAAQAAWEGSEAKVAQRSEDIVGKAQESAAARNASAQELEALAGRYKAEYYELAAEEGRLIGEISQRFRRLSGMEDDLERLGAIGLAPRRHSQLTTKRGTIISVEHPTDMAEMNRHLPRNWVPIARPRGYSKKRLYFRQTKKGADLSYDALKETMDGKAAAERRLAVVRRHLDTLGGKQVGAEGRALGRRQRATDDIFGAIDRSRDLATTEQGRRIAKMAEAMERMGRLSLKAEEIPAAASRRLDEIDFELRNAIRRAYSQTLEESRLDPTMVPEVRLADRLTGVSTQFGVDLQKTYDSALKTLDDDARDWIDLHDHLDTRMAALYKFVSARYDAVLENLREGYGSAEAVERLEGYTLHQIRNKDRILRRYPGKRLVGAAKSGQHRKRLTLRELKEEGYDPVEDVLTSLAAAEISAAELKWSRGFIDKALNNKAWAVPIEQWKKGAHGGDVMPFVHPMTGKEYLVDKEVGLSLERMLHAASNVDVRGRMGWVFDTLLVNPWKAWATYARPSFHLRNAYSNMWLMYAGGYDMAARPGRMSEALQIGSLRKLEELERGVGATRRALRGPGHPAALRRTAPGRAAAAARGKVSRAATAAADRMEDNWVKKLGEWADAEYTLKDGTVVNGRQLYDEMAQFGVVNKRWQAADVDRNAGSALQLTRKWDVASGAWKMLPFSQESYVLKFGSEVGLFVENHARSALYLDRRLHWGDTAFEAAQVVKRHLFDYKDITKADKSIRRYIPFWTWARKATAHEYWNLLNEPRRYAALSKTKRAVEASAEAWWDGDAEAKRAITVGADWLKRRNGWLTWFSTPWGSPQVWDPSQPWQEFQRFTPVITALREGMGAAVREISMGVLGQLVPAIKAPVSAALDVKMPEGRPFIAEMEATWLTGRILDVLGLKVRMATLEDGSTGPVYDERHIYALENPFPHIAVTSKTFSDPKMDPALEERRQGQVQREVGGTTRLGETKIPLPPGIGLHALNPAETRRGGAGSLSRELKRYHRGARRFDQ